MLFRSFILSDSTTTLTKFTLDVQSSTGYKRKPRHGNPPLNASKHKFYPTGTTAFGDKMLEDWLNKVKNLYPY